MNPLLKVSDQVERLPVYDIHHYSHLFMYEFFYTVFAESQCFKAVLQVSGGTAFKEAVSFELSEEELWDTPGLVDR